MTESKLTMNREHLAALRRRAERDSHEITLSATELVMGIYFLTAGLLQAGGLIISIIPLWLLILFLPMWWVVVRRLQRYYQRQLGKVKPLTMGRPSDVIILMLIVTIILEFAVVRWLDMSYPQLAEALRSWGFHPFFGPWMAFTFYLPLGLYLRIWRWVAVSLWSILGLGLLFVVLPELGISRFLVLSFFIPGTGYTLSGALFLRQMHHRMRTLVISGGEENDGRAI